MQHLFRKQIIKAILKITGASNVEELSSYEMAKAYREVYINTRGYLKDLVLIAMGVFSAAFGFKGFLLSNHFIDTWQSEKVYEKIAVAIKDQN